MCTALLLCMFGLLRAQEAGSCLPPAERNYQATIYFNYGSSSSASSKNRIQGSVGQPVTNSSMSVFNSFDGGFWAQFLVPPLPPFLSATQGEFLDRIQLNWTVNPLGAAPSSGFKLYRDGIFLALLDKNTFSYNDFNVIAGRAYKYTVKGVNYYGDGCPAEAIGFQVPNGTVTGWVQSPNGNPVSDVLVSLMPLQGFSLSFSGAQGAVSDTLAGDLFFPANNDDALNDYTLAFWIKTSASQNGDTIIRFDGYDMSIRAFRSQDSVGIRAYLKNDKLFHAGATGTAAQSWHHVALTYSAGVMRLYWDGELAGYTPVDYPPVASTKMYLGNSDVTGSGWSGKLDEFRIYHRRLTEVDLREVLAGTASRSTPGLKYYWKMDEELGNISYDIVNRRKLFFCGANFDSDKPAVCVSGRTNEEGYYRIESASYGTGTTFLARPSKYFYKYRALQLSRADSSFAVLPDFALNNKSTIELWLNSEGLTGNQSQCLLSRWWGMNRFEVLLKQSTNNPAASEIVFQAGGQAGASPMVLESGYHLLSFTIDSTSSGVVIQPFLDGIKHSTSYSFGSLSGNWSDTSTYWVIGANRDAQTDVAWNESQRYASWTNPENYKDFFSGLIDEFAVYDTILPDETILQHTESARDMHEGGISVYFPFDEGDGTTLNNCGSLPLATGTAVKSGWSTLSKFQDKEPHIFSPVTRQVTLNPSVTSVDQVDYVDQSLISVTGYVRYANTDCFAPGIEILVNGKSYSPKVFTDTVGQFKIDLEPGKSVVLSPKFSGDSPGSAHRFIPASWELTNVTTPIAGIVFNDVTTRKVTVTVAGGSCRVSTLGDQLGEDYKNLKLQAKTANSECFVSYGEMTSGTEYTFTLPPFRQVTVGLFSHDNPDIRDAIQNLGAATLDLSERDTSVEFIYKNPKLAVSVSGLPLLCDNTRYWDPALPLGATTDFTVNKVRIWDPPLPFGAESVYNGSTISVRYRDTIRTVVNGKVTLNGQIYQYSQSDIVQGNIVHIDGEEYSLKQSLASTVLVQGSKPVLTVMVKEKYPGGECIFDESDIRFNNGWADEVLDTALVRNSIEYKDTLKEPGGGIVPNRPIRVRLTIQPREISPLSEAYYTEVHQVTTDASGYYRITAGRGVPDTTVGRFEDVPSYPAQPYLKIETDRQNSGSLFVQEKVPVKLILTPTTLKYTFKVGSTNPVLPYYKTLQVISTTADGRQGSASLSAVIEGTRANGERFTTYMPDRPSIVLRDPPGDGSYSYISKDSTVCHSYTFNFTTDQGITLENEFDGSPSLVTFTGLGVGTIQSAESGVSAGFSASLVFSYLKEDGWQTCMTFNNTISTNDGDLIVGGDQGGDVYVGTAQNIIFGTSDRIKVTDCVIQADQVISFRPGGATLFRYSEYYVRRYLIPYLDKLAVQYNTVNKPDSAAIMRNSAHLWREYIKMNAEAKVNAEFRHNYSFDAGVTYEDVSVISRDDIDANEYTFSQLASAFANTGFNILGQGAEQTWIRDLTFSEIWHSEDIDSRATTVGYVLADDDPGDAFSVDILSDECYKTPVFKVKSGQSSCPHEKGTASRDLPVLETVPGFPLQAINIPSKQAAVFRFNLGNLSQTEETRHYVISAPGEYNPLGAVLKLNGASFNSDVDYEIPDRESLPITVTAERGPLDYEYNDLVIQLAASCELERANALGLDLSEPDTIATVNNLAYSKQEISIKFIQPCSEVDIDEPKPGYVILRNDIAQSPPTSSVRDIVITNYNTADTNFQAVRMQYRRREGDGIWTNIISPNTGASNPHERWNPGCPEYVNWHILHPASARPDTLRALSTAFKWETASLADGDYELRAISVCTGNATGMEGSSYYIPVRIEREPPKIVNWEPFDGVFDLGDEISFTFDKPLNSSLFSSPTGNPLNKIELYDTAPASGSGLISSTITSYGNRIFISPDIQNKFLENKILRVELRNLEDMAGNSTGPDPMKYQFRIPEFYVNRNELAWLEDTLQMTKHLDQTKTVTAGVHNRAGSPASFKITGAPDWVRVVPDQGSLAPNEILPVSFIVDSSLAFGLWNGTVNLETQPGQNPFFMGGTEPLPVRVRVICPPPVWELDAGQYENSMNMVLKLNIQGAVSSDEEDFVGAFINGELRGRAHLQYSADLNTWLAYMTVYGDAADVLDPVKLQIWDASECLLYGTVAESFQFQPDVVIGSPVTPQFATTNSLILREIPINTGWNWLSFNLDFQPTDALNQALSTLNHPEMDLIKSQSQFAAYSGAWFGSLSNLDEKKMYLYRADQKDTLQMYGLLIPGSTPVPVGTGWSWIGYIPNYSLEVNNALKSLKESGMVQNGDLIKSQTSFAQYIGGSLNKWIGNLEYMTPPNGYQLNLKKQGVAGNLIYPPPSFTDNPAASRNGDETPLNHWEVNPSLFESSATLIGMIAADGHNITRSGMELGAFAGNEVRGSAKAVYVEPIEAYIFFLTCYANYSGELFRFRLYNSDSGLEIPLNETTYFVADNHQGTIDVPLPFTLASSVSTEELADQSGFDIQPNPFSKEAIIVFSVDKPEEVRFTVSDVNGRDISQWSVHATAGKNTLVWYGINEEGATLQSGVYFVKLRTENGITTRKIMLQR